MRVKMLALSADADGVFPIGSVRDVSDEAAEQMVDGGFAELIDEPAKPKQASKASSAKESAAAKKGE